MSESFTFEEAQKGASGSFSFDEAIGRKPESRVDKIRHSYLGASVVSGLQSLVGTGAKILETVNPFTLSEEDAATLFKNDPEKLKKIGESPALALSRFSRAMQQASEHEIEGLSKSAKADYGDLKYATTDPAKAAYLSPVKMVGDAIQSLPTTLALAASVYFTKGVAGKVEAQALAEGAAPEVARSMAVKAASETMAKMSAATEGVAGYGTQYMQTREQADRVPDAKLQSSPEYQRLISDGYSPEAARVWLSSRTAFESGASGGMADAITNFFGGRIFGKIIAEGGGLAKRTAKGFGMESAQESIQSGLEQVGQNHAIKKYLDSTQGMLDGVAEHVAQGFFVGGLTGGALTGIAGGGQKPAEVLAAPTAPTPQLGFDPGPPMVGFPDGTVMTAAEFRNRGMDQQAPPQGQRTQAAVESILGADSVDAAIAVAANSQNMEGGIYDDLGPDMAAANTRIAARTPSELFDSDLTESVAGELVTKGTEGQEERIGAAMDEPKLAEVARLTRLLEEHDEKGLTTATALAYRAALARKLEALSAGVPEAPDLKARMLANLERMGIQPPVPETSTIEPDLGTPESGTIAPNLVKGATDSVAEKATTAANPATPVTILGKPLAALTDKELALSGKLTRSAETKAAVEAEVARRVQEVNVAPVDTSPERVEKTWELRQVDSGSIEPVSPVANPPLVVKSDANSQPQTGGSIEPLKPEVAQLSQSSAPATQRASSALAPAAKVIPQEAASEKLQDKSPTEQRVFGKAIRDLTDRQLTLTSKAGRSPEIRSAAVAEVERRQDKQAVENATRAAETAVATANEAVAAMAKMTDEIKGSAPPAPEAAPAAPKPPLLSRSKEDLSFTSEALSELAKEDDLFRYPRGNASTIDGVMKEIDPTVEYAGDATREDERQETGADKRQLFKTADGHDAYVYESGKDVWIDVSRLEEGKGGSAIYSAAMDYAKNTGKTFVGDPAGLSEAAVIRRTVAMLSSALKHDSTKHLAPAKEQASGLPDKGIRPLAWRVGDDVANVQALADTLLSYLEARQPGFKDARYDFDQRAFVDSNGVPYSEADLAKLVERGRDGEAKIGSNTLKSGLVLSSLVRSQGSERPRLLEQVVRQSSELVGKGGLDGIFSKGAPTEGLSVDSVQRIIDPVVAEFKNVPSVTVVERQEDIPQVAEMMQSAKERFVRGDQGAESDLAGFIKRPVEGAYVDGKIWLVAGNLRSRKRVLDVLAHEVVGHMSVENMLDQADASLMPKLLKQVNLLDSGGNQYIRKIGKVVDQNQPGLDKQTRAKEIIAMIAERGDQLKDVGPSVRSLVQRIMDGIRSFFKLAFNMTLTDADVRDIVATADRWARGDEHVTAAVKGGFESVPLEKLGAAETAAAPSLSRSSWVSKQSPDTQEALRKAGLVYVPLTLKDRVKAWSADWQKRVTQGVVDQFAPIKEYSYHSYMLARMTRGADAALDGLLNYGTIYLDNQGAIDVNFEQGGFLGIMSKLKGEHDRFLGWVIGNRAERLLAEGREHNFTAQDVARLKALNQGQMKDGSSRTQEYSRIRGELDRYNKVVLDIAEKAGLVDGSSRKAWEKDFYVPFYRLMEDASGQPKGPMPSKGLVNQYAFKVLKGGDQALGDPMQNILKNWSHLIDASLKNQAARESLLAAQKVGGVIEGTEDTVRQMAKAAGLKDAVASFTDNGVQRWFMVEDAFLLDAIKGIGFTGFQGKGMRVMGMFKRWLTYGVTVSPTFRIRNLMRDSIQMIGANPASYNVLDNALTGWKATKEGSQEFASILAGGGVMRFGTLLDGDRAAHVKRLIDAGVDDKTILNTPQKIKGMVQEGIDWWQRVGDRAENINRAALYKKLRSEGKTHLEASFAARDAMDFSMQGTWAAIRFLSQTVPFFNARLQGMYKLGRGAVEDPRRFGIVAGATTLAALSLLFAYEDDEDWKAREDWDRETFFWFKIGDKAFRIPKPFEIGALATIAERGMEYMMTDELTGKQFGSRVFHIISQQLSMNPIPQMAVPLIELYANRDSFTDRPIETIGMEHQSKPKRIGPNTSAAAQLVGKNGFVSPAQIDHLVNGYFGWLGTHAIAVADVALRPAMDLPEKPALRVDDYAVIGDFMKNLPAYQSKYLTRVYDQSKEVKEAMADLRALQKVGAIEEAQELLEKKGDKLKLYRMFSHAEHQLQTIGTQIKLTQARKMDADEKRERLDALYAMRTRVAKTLENRTREPR